MIRRLKIRNFQSHGETELDLHPGVNVIVGDSDSGKTAILRALDWVLNNVPGGTSFRRAGTKETVVEAWLGIPGAKGIERIVRTRTKSKNLYHLDRGPKHDGESKEFGSLGKGGVPPEVAEAVNMGDLNWKRQHDAPFLLARSWTPGAVASKLNEVVDLEVIDRSISGILSLSSENLKAIRDLEGRLDGFEDGRKVFDSLHDMEMELRGIEDELKRGKKIQMTAARLIELDGMASWHDACLGAAAWSLEADEDLKALEDLQEAMETREAARKPLASAVWDAMEAERALTGLSPLLDGETALSALTELNGRIEELDSIGDSLSQIVRKAEAAANTTKRTGMELEELEARFHDEIGEVCPLCGQEVER